MALLRQGDGAGALELLRRALPSARAAPARASVLFYLGEAELSLGRAEEGRASLAQARGVAPESRFGRLATERLASLQAPAT